MLMHSNILKKTGFLIREIAQKFKDTVLSQGGTVDPLELYIKFRGQNQIQRLF